MGPNATSRAVRRSDREAALEAMEDAGLITRTVGGMPRGRAAWRGRTPRIASAPSRGDLERTGSDLFAIRSSATSLEPPGDESSGAPATRSCDEPGALSALPARHVENGRCAPELPRDRGSAEPTSNIVRNAASPVREHGVGNAS
jgi:hypothetical protein